MYISESLLENIFDADYRQTVTYKPKKVASVRQQRSVYDDEPAYRSRGFRWRVADQKQPFDIHETLEDFSTWYRQSLMEQGLVLVTKISASLPRHIKANPLMIGYLLWDLATYSLSHLDDGGAVFEVKCKPAKDGLYTISFTITASGLGIPQTKEKNLFCSAAVAADDYEEDTTNLYYARMIARRFAGDVKVHNSYGHGTRYVVEVRLPGAPD